jgi:hypothetical protein
MTIVMVLSLGPAQLIKESRMYPFPNQQTCEVSLKAALDAEKALSPNHTRVVTKAVCEPLG